MNSGANLQLGGYVLVPKSEIWEGVDRNPWNKTAFEALRKRADAAGKVIIAQFETEFQTTLDKATFMKSAREFLKDYPVDGFGLNFPVWPNEYQVRRDFFAAARELKLRTSLSVLSSDLPKLEQSGLGKDIDEVVVTPWPSSEKESIKSFNTDSFAEDVIKGAVKAGVDLNKLIFRVPLLAKADYGSADMSYANAIYDLGADPRGNGSFLYSGGFGYYFFSQPRASEKVALAKKYGLLGIGLQGGKNYVNDLYPWDTDSLFHAIA
ncbi:hypothetical protein Pmar_PMAR008808 [Perkinsus marinus ATCC 50983]|uniref:Uncharacterized protein n=1 Tax=Perkinsus marinus (strain ATCC 50983 / TXsc) TaxID=423536 RepID=C5L127_PERM5|nr:hypothetical protein Pmar_PMAR008808 [Perkinsus marinus ATCC 50983]EER09669.1 hypothetical protein Pmar_PMAR008808 [Perkinsus marinus ATCC 50983]|eukprot:XP_002777874.1 hypothetical protein Pmar_PMAR008808 [Perkinsus marinus ATCC 50983]